jgi:DNA-binding transcriptional LysR family regulator
MVSLLQLESFVAVAEEENLSRAARRLCVSQPPLTRRIQSLEDELGVALFRRTARGMRLMPSGHSLLPHARQILALTRVDRMRTLIEGAPLHPGVELQVQAEIAGPAQRRPPAR